MGSYKGKIRDILIQYTKVLEHEVVNPARKQLEALKGDMGMASAGASAMARDGAGDAALIDDLIGRMEQRLSSIKRHSGDR